MSWSFYGDSRLVILAIACQLSICWRLRSVQLE